MRLRFTEIRSDLKRKKKNIWYDVMIPTTHRHLYLSLCHQISFRLLHALQSKYTLHKSIKAIARCIRTKSKVERFGTFIIVYRKSKCFQVTDFPEINARDKYTIALRLRLLLYISSAHALIHVRVYIHIYIYIYFPFFSFVEGTIIAYPYYIEMIYNFMCTISSVPFTLRTL